MAKMNEIDSLRRKIDIMDDILIEGLLKRFELTDEVAAAKRKLGMDIEVPERENEIRLRIEKAVFECCDNAQKKEEMLKAILNIYDKILAESKLLQGREASLTDGGKES